MKVKIISLGKIRHSTILEVKELPDIVKYCKKYLRSREVDYEGDEKAGFITAGLRVVGGYEVIEA